MIKGVLGKTYLDLSNIFDLKGFDQLHPSICRGFATATHVAQFGNLDIPGEHMNTELYKDQFKLLSTAYQEFLNLPEDDPIRIGGEDLKDNQIVTYLKYALGGYDLYSFYVVYDFTEGWREDSNVKCNRTASDYFPEVTAWIDSLIDQKIFSHVGRATFFVQEAGGVSFEHHDPSIDPEHPEILSEFIHLRPTLERLFYVKDRDTLEKTYIDARAAWWNDQDRHGGESLLLPSYSLRIDGVFTEEFKLKIKHVAEHT